MRPIPPQTTRPSRPRSGDRVALVRHGYRTADCILVPGDTGTVRKVADSVQFGRVIDVQWDRLVFPLAMFMDQGSELEVVAEPAKAR